MSDYEQHPSLNNLPLGKPTTYTGEYNPALLKPVPRSINRDALGIETSLPFHGEDVWYGYETSWLNKKGKPQVAVLKCAVPCTSMNMIESKSFKLYLNSFNQSRFNDQNEVIRILTEDLSACAGGEIAVSLFGPNEIDEFTPTEFPGTCIDELEIEIDQYQLDSELLIGAFDVDHRVEETVYSHLLKSNCLITGQPDWASLIICYRGSQVDCEKLLRYIVSFRQHNEFHEQCVERIFIDMMCYGDFDALSVQACYTRRGGLDIMPFRTTETASAPRWRSNRQ